MSAQIDRAKVVKFFAWTSREFGSLIVAIGCMIVASWISYLGVAVALQNAERAGILLYTSTGAAVFLGIAGLFVRRTLRGDKQLLEFHDEVNKAKAFDFANALIRSFQKTGTALDNLLDFDDAAPAAAACEASGHENGQLLETLRRKAVFLPGWQGNTEFLKFLFRDGSLIAERSPVPVAVLYLTKRELIVYLASADIVKGDVTAEEIRRIPLQKVVDVTMEQASRRAGRMENERLFQEYERVIRNHPANELICTGRAIRVVKADGEDLVLPAGNPVYGRGKPQGAHALEEERLSHIARNVSRSIDEIKATAESDLRPKL